MKLKDKLIKIGACSEAVYWVGDRDIKTAWAECERADWMLWYAEHTGVDQKLIVLAACACARIALKHVPTGESRPLDAIQAAEKWADDPTEINRAAAEAAAWAAEAAARAAAGAAAGAAEAAAWAAAAAAGAEAWAAAAATGAAAGAAAWSEAMKNMANIVRGIITLEKTNRG